ncbi:MAG TPA: TIGR03435 family protein [Acidobacteriaceae bacterium]|nr:TIGR03435 family protein [Acidobacteriaceae bacterium]
MIAMQRTVLFSAVLLCGVCGTFAACGQDTQAVKPMAKDADPSFEVAVIKPSDPNDKNQAFGLEGHRIHIENNSMIGILCFAYSIQKSQIVNAPEWFTEQRWDIDGVPDVEGTPSWDQYRGMLQKLLATRFGLKMHHDKRELSVYTLTVTKGGAKLEKSKSAPDALSDASGHGMGSGQYMKFTNETMPGFAHVVQMMGLDRPVIDQTNLAGRYDFSLTWTPDAIRAAEPNAPPALFTAVQEQLGLKLEATRAPADVFVIDAATKPTQN